MQRNNNALTLIEILVALTIFAILSTISFISILGYNSQTRDAVRLSHVGDIESVIELYKALSNIYPEPSEMVEVTASGGVLVWSQGVFGQESMQQTGKIFGDVQDPLYGNYYPYSVTSNRREYQLSYILEQSNIRSRLPMLSFEENLLLPQAHASFTFFDPGVLEPTIWLDANDINGDGSSTSQGATINTWINKGTRGSTSNAVRTHGTITYRSDSVGGMPAVFVPKQAGLRFNDSSISQGEIYFVLHDSGGKAMGYGLQGTSGNYVIGAFQNYRNSLRINNAPNHLTTAPAIKNENNREAFFYSFFTDGINYEFRNSGNFLSQGATNSIEGVNWAFNRAGRFNRVNENADWGVGEFIVFDSALSEDAQYMVEGYLAHTWGLTESLPSSHPYKDSPPLISTGGTENPPTPEIQEIVNPGAPIFIRGSYNKLFTHGTNSSGLNQIFVTPSIIASDLTNPSFEHIVTERKLVYPGYESLPAGYNIIQDNNDYQVFPFELEYPIAFSGSRSELASYRGIREIEQYLRYSYRYSPIFRDVSGFFEGFGTQYVENILSSSIGVNPIKPYYCQEILERRFIFNLADFAEIDATPTAPDSGVQGVAGINNGVKSVEGSLNSEYKMDQQGGYIEFTWEEDIPAGFIRIYNSLGSLSSGLSQAEIQLYRHNESTPIYTHTLWNTTGDYIVDLDLEGIGQLHNDIRRIVIIADEERYISLREVEIYAGGSIEDGYYKVDSDGIGGRGSYTIYCDMTTDGGGWTKIGENFIDKSFFEGNNHPNSFGGYLASGNINIISENTLRNDIAGPTGFPQVTVLRHSGDTNSLYRLSLDNIPNIEFTTEIRLSAWVKGVNQSPFGYTINYRDQAPESIAPSDIYDGNSSEWRYETIRIPITDYINSFSWDIGAGIDARTSPLDITGLKLEVYYK
ncbi:prepilin-type N-terminal cleavage/methylation domain-containing protein [Candidatus Gracilibacteria bacterium]|nr:prepilin-type N-terminal cleavage/methylation domain-containing protein [Candidatus Gracilibacteria bacterium]